MKRVTFIEIVTMSTKYEQTIKKSVDYYIGNTLYENVRLIMRIVENEIEEVAKRMQYSLMLEVE